MGGYRCPKYNETHVQRITWQTCCQFHQHFTSTFGSNTLWPKNYKANRKKPNKTFFYKEAARKLLVKLTLVKAL